MFHPVSGYPARYGYSVRHVHVASRPAILGETDSGNHTVTLYEYPGEDPALRAKVAAYEGGHVVDLVCLTPGQRTRWLAMRHATAATWYAPNLAPEQRFGSGDFADVFSLWATGSYVYFHSELRHAPNAHDLNTLAIRFHFAKPC